MFDGKKVVAEKIVYDAIEKIKKKSKEEPINLNEIQILEEESGLNVISNVVIIPSSFEPDPLTYNSSNLLSSYGVSRSNDSSEESYNPLHFLKASFNTLDGHINVLIKNIEGSYDETSRIKGSKVELFDKNDNLIYTHPTGTVSYTHLTLPTIYSV